MRMEHLDEEAGQEELKTKLKEEIEELGKCWIQTFEVLRNLDTLQ